MTNTEFIEVMGYLTAGSGKDIPAAAKLVYFDCLQDLGFEAFKLGAKWVLMHHRFATFPTIAELREASTSASRGTVVELSPAKAFEIAWKIIANTDPEIEGSFARAAKGAPPAVVETIRAMGIPALCYGKEPVGVVRAQFERSFTQIAAGEKRRALLPASLTQAIEGRGAKSLPANVLDGIGIGGAK